MILSNSLVFAAGAFLSIGMFAFPSEPPGTTPTPRGCPDRKATSVELEINDLGQQTACSIGIQLANGEVWIPTCPEKMEWVPSHGECHGEPNEGTRCVIAGDLPVLTSTCSCSPVIHLPSGWVAAGCTCTDFVHTGTVEDFVTQTCN